jgi:hypothetical protein
MDEFRHTICETITYTEMRAGTSVKDSFQETQILFKSMEIIWAFTDIVNSSKQLFYFKKCDLCL